MPFINTNDAITGRINPVSPAGAENVSVRFSLALTTGDLAINSAGQIGILPAGCVPVQLLVDASDMDSGAAALVLSVGILDTAASTLLSTTAANGGGAWGSTAAAATEFQQQVLGRPIALVQRSDVDRLIGIRVLTAPTVAVAGTLGLTLVYRSA